ncbi:MAG TPA: GGDEF domain-containing protein, partial [Novosphingobium sp.]|nr:GGDEF domain-containing protein [Novosphingobium sp.]
MSMPSTDQPSPAPPFPPERDPLTGLPGMAAARRRLARWEGERDTGEGGHVHALLLGLRRFEAVNLAYGEETGDEALIAIARRVAAHASAVLDGPCLTARGPGGTFLVIAEEACSRERWQMFAEQLADLVARPIARRGGALRLSPRVALLRVLAG